MHSLKVCFSLLLPIFIIFTVSAFASEIGGDSIDGEYGGAGVTESEIGGSYTSDSETGQDYSTDGEAGGESVTDSEIGGHGSLALETGGDSETGQDNTCDIFANGFSVTDSEPGGNGIFFNLDIESGGDSVSSPYCEGPDGGEAGADGGRCA